MSPELRERIRIAADRDRQLIGVSDLSDAQIVRKWLEMKCDDLEQ